jgi:hypothetical protein
MVLVFLHHNAPFNNAPKHKKTILRDFRLNTRIPLKDLTRLASDVGCSGNLVEIRDIVRDFSEDNETSSRFKIPLILHQTGKTRCLAPEFAHLVRQWQRQPRLSYHFHDDDAVNHFLSQDFPEFPTLSSLLSCIQSPTLRADLWRYLLLWEYGGIYADLDTIPQSNVSLVELMRANDRGFFVVDHYHYLSQYFMCIAPRHPLMYYTIQAALSNVLLARDTGSINPARTTGPVALHRGLQVLLRDGHQIDLPDSLPNEGSQKQLGPVEPGIYVGASDRDSIRVVGTHDNEVIQREGLKRGEKILAYKKMEMQHFSKSRLSTKTSCLALLYHASNQGTKI